VNKTGKRGLPLSEISRIAKYKFLWVIALALFLLVSAELAARFLLGLGDPLVYQSDPDYGYRPVPNQDVRRFGNRIFYNAQGLRSEPITKQPAPGTIRILCVGDSITFGGTQTDQAATYPYQLQGKLNRQVATLAQSAQESPLSVKVPNRFIMRPASALGLAETSYRLPRYEVLNASAAGWATMNQEAFLRKFGTFNSDIVVLQVASHDLFQPKISSNLVEESPSFPTQKPVLALQEALFRYALPKYFPELRPAPDPSVETQASKDDLERNLASLERINSIVKAHNSQLVVFLIEQPDKYEPKSALYRLGKQAFTDKAQALNLPHTFLKAEDIRKAGGQKLFRDPIHPNPQGNKLIAKEVAELVQQQPLAKVKQYR